MAKPDPDRDTYNKAVRDHIISVLDSGVSRRVMANVLVVTRAAISSYVIGRTTPKPYIIERLLMKWPTNSRSAACLLALVHMAAGTDARVCALPKRPLLNFELDQARESED